MFFKSKLSQTVYAIRKIHQICGQDAALNAYYVLFHSRLLYKTVCWGNVADTHIKRVFILKKSAIRAITCAS